MPPQVNATLTAVGTPGSTDDFRTGAPSDEAVFSGGLPAYYQRTRRRVSGITQAGGAATAVIIDHTLLLDPLPFAVAEGQVIEFECDGTEYTAEVQAVEAPVLPGIPEDLQTVRLTLEVQ